MFWKKLTLVGCLLALGGCAAEAGECYLPGDTDCSTSSDTKSDAWDSANDPRRIANDLNYRLSDLPPRGRAEQEAWSASYWPTAQGSSNHRWQGEETLSPLEKYDMAVNDWTPDSSSDFMTDVPRECGQTAEAYRDYRDWLGPAARWQSGSQGRDQMYDGIDNDGDGETDECGTGENNDYDGIESWWGLCHAWAPAALLVPEPLEAVEYNGVNFEVSDIKGLIMTVFDGTDSLFLGGRCNAREFEHDDNHRVTQDECRDVNAGAWHVVVSNLLGLQGKGFVEDRTGGFQVWNQPLVGYEVDKMEEISLEQAHAMLGVEGETYEFNPDATRFFEVKMTTDWLTEGHQSKDPLGSDSYLRHDNYHYILELSPDGKIIGGEWLGESRENHPDFLWVPLRAKTGYASRANPNVDYETVMTLIELSRSGMNGGSVDGTTFSNEEIIDIPDAADYVESIIEVEQHGETNTVSVTVDIAHTYRGDLVIELSHDGQSVTLLDQEGGSQHDVLETFTVDDFAGSNMDGEWILRVSDHAQQDVGTINKFSVTFVQ